MVYIESADTNKSETNTKKAQRSTEKSCRKIIVTNPGGRG